MRKTMFFVSLLVTLSMLLASCASPTAIPIQPTSTLVPTPAPTPTLGIGSTMTRAKDGMTMVYVPEGPFTMGSDEIRDAKAHTVTLGSYWIDQTEMTNGKYELCVTAGACKAPNGSSPSYASYYGNPDYADYPVIYMDWNQAKTYCEWAGARLPTEAEWEKAARGTDGRTYPWGENIDETYANYYYSEEHDPIDTTKVDSFEKGKSPYGAYDMAGNVLEWVSSQYRDYPYSATDGREDLNATNVFRVWRGGAWDFKADKLRSAYRNYSATDLSEYSTGFRCASSTAP